MNKLKVLAACVAFACAGQASATLTDVTNTTTGSSLFLIVWKGVDGTQPGDKTYVRDLGQTLNNAVNLASPGGPISPWNSPAGDTFTVNLSTDTNFTSNFTAGDTVFWTVAGGIGSGTLPQYAISLDTVGGAIGNSAVAPGGTNKINGVIGSANGVGCSPSCILPGGAATWGGTGAFWGTALGGQLPGGYNDAGNGYGDTTFFYNVVKTGSSGAATINQFKNATQVGLWKLTFGQIQYTLAPVPEPSAALLLTAGLAFMGFVARRRMRD
jgi:hypothetical protein